MRLYFPTLPYAVWIIIFGTFISRFGTSMIVPYITVLLVNTKHLPIYYAGLTIGGSYIAQTFGASILGSIFHQIKPLRIIKLMLCFYALLFLLLGIASHDISTPWLIGGIFIICFFCIGTCRSVIETGGQTIISEETPFAQKNIAFNLRYTLINLGTSLGPIVGMALGILNTLNAFYAAACAIFVYFLLLQFTVTVKTLAASVSHTNLINTFRWLFVDKKLLYFILANILCYVGFSQMEALFAYISLQYTNNSHIFVVMYAINTISIVLLQIPLSQYASRFNLDSVVLCGALLLTIGLLGVLFSKTHVFTYYFSMFIFTLGEIFSLSLTGIYLDRLALPEKRYLYFGMGNLGFIGSTIGPPVATILCYFFGLQVGVCLIAFVTLLAAPCMWMAKKHVSLQTGEATTISTVIPAKAGIFSMRKIDSRLRGNDRLGVRGNDRLGARNDRLGARGNDRLGVHGNDEKS